MSEEIDFSTDASSFEEMPQEKLNSLAELAKEARELEEKIAKANAFLTEKSDRLRMILEKLMPDIMLEMNVQEIKLTTGEKLINTKFYAASIKEEYQEAAFKWLRERNHDSIIKNEVKGSFGKGEDERVREIAKKLEEIAPGIFTTKTFVHPMTLKSFVKEQVESGQEIPADLFGLHIGNKVKIK